MHVAWDSYGGVEKALDQTIKIGGNAFRIIGVAARQDDDELESGGSDDFVWMPYSCAAKMTRNANISSYTFATADMNHTEEAKRQSMISSWKSLRMRTYTGSRR